MMSAKVNVKDLKRTLADVSQEIEAKTDANQVIQMIDSRINAGISARGIIFE